MLPARCQAVSLRAGSGWSYAPVGRFQTAAGEALNVYLSTAVATSGELTYIEVD